MLRRREILCKANISRPLRPPTKLLNKKHAGVRRAAPLQLPPLHAAKSETIPVLQPIQIRVELFRCFKKTPPRETRALGSTPQPGTGDHRWASSNTFTGKAARLLLFFVCLFSTYIIINSLQVVYKHWYRLNNKLESSIDFLSVSVHCVLLQEAITFLKVAYRLHQT